MHNNYIYSDSQSRNGRGFWLHPVSSAVIHQFLAVVKYIHSECCSTWKVQLVVHMYNHVDLYIVYTYWLEWTGGLVHEVHKLSNCHGFVHTLPLTFPLPSSAVGGESMHPASLLLQEGGRGGEREGVWWWWSGRGRKEEGACRAATRATLLPT